MNTPLIRVNDTFTRHDAKREYAEFWKEMLPHVVVAVELTFLAKDAGAMTNVTTQEIKERTRIAKILVDTLRQDLKWGKVRIKDNLGIILRSHIAGIDLDLNALGKRGSW